MTKGMQTSMMQFKSVDGTQIAYERSGTGSPLVLVHGSTTERSQWSHLIPKLNQYFTVYAIDRRGRGQSGDTQPYSITREFEDIAALIDSIPGRVNLLGHSYGALCSLEANLLTKNVDKLLLYEPPIYTNFKLTYPPGMLSRIDSLVKEGNNEEALLFLYEMAQTRTSEVALLKSLPSWEARKLVAHTVVRELIGVEDYVFGSERFKDLKVPTCLLQGGDSAQFYREAIETLHQKLPQSRIVTLPGQQHEAIDVSPELFLREVLNFFSTP